MGHLASVAENRMTIEDTTIGEFVILEQQKMNPISWDCQRSSVFLSASIAVLIFIFGALLLKSTHKNFCYPLTLYKLLLSFFNPLFTYHEIT